ncbi:MAG TPA: hypothetical protein VNO35_25790 [Steroidobacteraceae bacterium]|nr:hypothetical protein [Steroidobacteraceae bacterium]
MKTLSFIFGLLFALAACAQTTTVTIPAQTVMAPVAIPAQATVPAQTIAVPVTIPAQTITIPTPTSSIALGSTAPAAAASATRAPAVGAHATTEAAGSTAPAAAIADAESAATPGTFWVYHGGKFRWGGDYSWGSGKVDYRGKDPQSGERVIAIIGDEGLQPYATGNDFNTAGYNYVVVSLKPTVEGQNWTTGAEMEGDKPIPGGPGDMQSVMPYGPNPAEVGEWNTYKIPLSVYGIKPGLHILKIGFLQKQKPAPDGQVNWYAKDIGFSP